MVVARRRGKQLALVAVDAQRRQRAVQIASDTCAIARAHVGGSREALLQALKAVHCEPRDKRMAVGLQKLVVDRCTFLEATEIDPEKLRACVFALATKARHAEAPFSREAVLAEASKQLAISAEDIERFLFSDLPGAHILHAAQLPSAETLVELWQDAQLQAVALRAVQLVAQIELGPAADVRQLFRTLKFHQLLFSLQPVKTGSYQLTIDGPFSLFESVTRYGLRLALAIPHITSCSKWAIEADIRWGKERTPLKFHATGASRKTSPAQPATKTQEALPAESSHPLPLLIMRLQEILESSAWSVSEAQQILDVPGFGTCMPDLRFENKKTGAVVLFEMLGFWSRAAVWKRIEMVQAGLSTPIVFGVSKKLRVGEQALESQNAALYEFARVPSAKAVLQRIEAVSQRTGP